MEIRKGARDEDDRRTRYQPTIVGLASVCLIAGGTRATTAKPVMAAAAVGATAAVVVAAVVIAIGRRHRRAWRHAWWLLWVALVTRAAATFLDAAGPTGAELFPTWSHALRLTSVLAALMGASRLMRHRHPGRAGDVMFESIMGATVVGLVAWIFAVEPGVPQQAGDAAHLYALTMVGLGVAAVWTVVRLIWLTDDHPTAYRYLAAGLLCLLTADAVVAGGLLDDWLAGSRYVSALELWASVLWVACAMHPSIRDSFDPVPSKPDDLRRARVIFLVGAVLVGPALIVWQAIQGESMRLVTLLSAGALVPLLVVGEMVRQVRERATREYRAQHDGLTGLPNRVLFYDRLQIALAHARRSNRRVGVMFLDLDRFKEVNDSLGHDVGNQLLQAVARRLRRCLRDHDTVARLGGDEFTILLMDLDRPEDCGVVAEKVLRAFAEPFPVTGRTLFAATSIGIAVFPEDGVDADTLLKNADTAMYRAKAKGRSGYEFYTKDMSTRAEVRHSLEASLHRAIQREELVLHYQPKVHARNGRVLGLEALVRWDHPRLGAIPPSAFIPLAEESGLILPLGAWVLVHACQQAAEWSRSDVMRMPVAVNVSARQFIHEPLERVVERVLDETGLDPALLELELTESVFLGDVNAVNATMRQLLDMGVRCSIDDFGTGFSGLNYLNRMPIDSLKIDRSFVAEIQPHSTAPIVTAMIAMAASLNLHVVAEGVETPEQVAFLADHGCEQMQGYLFCRPLPAGELERRLRIDQGILRGIPAATGSSPIDVPASVSVLADADPRSVIDLLERACAGGDPLAVDPVVVEAVLAALADDVTTLAGSWGSKSLPVRLAVGTFAGLIPLSGGLVAADVLPDAAQRIGVRAFANVGIALPNVDGPDAVTLAAPAPADAGQRGHGRAPRDSAGKALEALRPPVDVPSPVHTETVVGPDNGAETDDVDHDDPTPRRRRHRPVAAPEHAPAPAAPVAPAGPPAPAAPPATPADPQPPAQQPPVTVPPADPDAAKPQVPGNEGTPPGHADGPKPGGPNPDAGNPDPGGNPSPGNPNPDAGNPNPGNPDPGNSTPGGANPNPGGNPNPGNAHPGNSDPGADPNAGSPNAGNPNPGAGNPTAGNPSPGNPNPGAGNPDPGNADPGNTSPGGANPDAGNPLPGNPNGDNANPVPPDAGNPNPQNPSAGNSNPGADPNAGNPNPGGNPSPGNSDSGADPNAGNPNPGGGDPNPGGGTPDPGGNANSGNPKSGQQGPPTP